LTPGAQVEAAIGLLTEIEQRRLPADDVVANYFRRHRFAGAKDRAAIAGHLYAVLRRRAQLDWWIERKGAGLPTDARRRMLGALRQIEDWPLRQIEHAFDGDRFRPPPLGPAERDFLQAIAEAPLEAKSQPAPVRGNFPAWLEPALARVFGADLGAEMAALNGEAPLVLRANRLKGDRDAARRALREEGIDAEPTRWSPLGLRLAARVPLGSSPAFRSGLVEVQDESSQMAVLIADARPGTRVVDFCAGAGGKTLALAAEMRNRGHLVACDVSAARLERATQRLRRAGASIVQRVPLTSERDKWVKRHAATFDRVFVDAPCTGTGTWRRNPDAKWRLRPEDLLELAALQREILASAQRLVKPGGRLLYATCSLLAEENEEQVEGFLAAHGEFAALPVGEIWAATVGGTAPVEGPWLRLSPRRHGTDGFFAAVLQRRPKAKEA